MTLRKNNFDYTQDWPLHYYEIDDIDLRRTILQDQIDEYHREDDIRRLEILNERYNKKNHDLFLHAFLTLTVIQRNAGFLTKNSENKRTRKYMQILHIGERVDTLLLDEWYDLIRVYILLCFKDHRFSTGAFGLAKLKDEAIANKIANQIYIATVEAPSQFDLQDSFQLFLYKAQQAYVDLIENGEIFWSNTFESN